ncbi:Regulator of chromosome condensation [Cladochytrium tenue]|nr:Regulator of chromosome condensation [Cladochytrium tenue]
MRRNATTRSAAAPAEAAPTASSRRSATGAAARQRGSAVVLAASGVSPPRPPRHAAQAAADAAFPLLSNPDTVVGEVFVVGNGDCGQLGLGPDHTQAARPRKIAFLTDKEIVSIAAGGLHNMALSRDGKLYSWGCNDHFALGREGEETEPEAVQGLDGVKIIQVVCGDSITVALSDDGNVYAWGTFRNMNGVFGFRPNVDLQRVPFRIPELRHIVQIHAGANHAVAFAHDRKIYTWGCGEQGQLCRRILPRSQRESALIPRIINFRIPRGVIPANHPPAGHPGGRPAGGAAGFSGVWCGGHHTFIAHESGVVFAVGLNNHGQLGVGDTVNSDTPRVVLNSDGGEDGFDGVVAARGSDHHSVLLDRRGHVFAFGRNDDGQLGLGDTKMRTEPTFVSNVGRDVEESTKVPFGEPCAAREISAFGAFTLALLVRDAEGNNMTAWGYGEMGQLCNGSEDSPHPFIIKLKGRYVLHVAAGVQHSVMLIRPVDSS